MFMVAISLIGTSALAQMDQYQMQNRFSEELRKTDRVIEQARMAINRTNTAYGQEFLRIANEKAGELLRKAETQQNHARAFDNNTSSLTDLAFGGKLTMTARELAFKAIAIKKRAEGKVEENENTILRQLEKVDRLTEQLRNNAPANVPDRLKSSFDTALENQRRAWELFREQALRAALKLSHQAEKTLLKLQEHMRAGNIENHRLQNQIGQTEQKMEQIRIKLKDCNSDEAREFMNQAEQKLNECYQYSNENENEKAQNSLRNAQHLMQQAARFCSDTESVTRAVNRLEAEIERYSDQIISSGNGSAIKLMEAARQHLRKAKQLCDNGETDSCAASVKAAQMNLRKALKLTGI
jgi:hypothetical protein